MDLQVTQGEELLVDSLELEEPVTTSGGEMEATAAQVEEVHILWISEGMSCDRDSVSVTAAGQPGIEDVLLGAIPGFPR